MGFLIGLDGGAAKTAGALCDAEGRVLARARGGGSAIVGKPTARFYSVITPLLETLTQAAGVRLDQVDAVVFGLSGVDFADEIPAQHRHIAKQLSLGERLVLVNDGLIALWGVSTHDRVALVQHGSGLTTAYRSALGEEAIYDSLDIAEIYDLRRDAVVRTARMIDGRLAPTALKDMVLQHCGVDADHFVEWCMRDAGAPARRSAVAEVVFAAWRQGDPAATEMVQRAARDYVLATEMMSRRMGPGPLRACFSGGVIRQGGGAFQRVIDEALKVVCPDAEHVDVALPPELGALAMGGWRTGKDLPAFFAALSSQHETADGPA